MTLSFDGFVYTSQLYPACRAGAITLEKLPEPNPKDEQPLYVAQLELQPEGIGGPITYVARSYIDITQGARIIFPSTRAIPGFPGATPKGLEGFRQQELAILRVCCCSHAL